MSTPVIEISDLSKRFFLSHEGEARYKSFREVLTKRALFWKKTQNGSAKEEFWALNNVSFNVNAGDRVGIIGRNGAGKSTLLKILSRITEPTKGEIKIRGRVASLLEVGTGFHPELTGRENIFLNGAILGMGRSEIRRKFDEIVAFAEIERFLDTPVKRYSSGMYVRLAFAVAAHLDPEILIVDEVLAVGDAQFQKKCLGKMEDVSKGEGRTVLFVSHQLGMVKSLCDKGVVLSKGSVVFNGTASAAIDHYINDSLDKNNEAICFFEENTDLNAQIISCQITNANNEGQLRFDVFESIYLQVTYVVRNPVTGMNLSYSLDKNAETIGYSFDTDFNEALLSKRTPGIYTFRVKLPYPLKAGQYQISSLGLGIVNLGAFNVENNIFSFEVVEESFDPTYKSFSSNRDGIIVFNNHWEQISFQSK